MPRVLYFAVALCLFVAVSNGYPTVEEAVPDVAQPVAVEPVVIQDPALVADDAASVDENGRPKRQFIAGLLAGALLAGHHHHSPYYSYGYGRPHYGGYGYHGHRPHYHGYGGYGGYYGYGK